MADLKTPVTYISEISAGPYEVNEIESAVPCFIGYTEKAIKLLKDDLLFVPHKITSISEFEKYFGKGPLMGKSSYDSSDLIRVTLNAKNKAVSVKLKNKYFLYDALRLFYSNGGDKCYIISAGNYSDTVSYGTPSKPGLKDALEVLGKIKDATIIYIPDSVLLTEDDHYRLMRDALSQCGNLRDRMLICDLWKGPDFNSDTQNFRSKIGNANLEFGAAYAPWLKTSLPANVHFRNIMLTKLDGSAVLPENLTKDPSLKTLISHIRYAIDASNKIRDNILKVENDTFYSVQEYFEYMFKDYENKIREKTSDEDLINMLSDIYDLIINLSKRFFDFGNSINDIAEWKLKSIFKDIIRKNRLESEMQKLLYHSNEFYSRPIISEFEFNEKIKPYYSLLLINKGDSGKIHSAYLNAGNIKARAELALKAAIDVFHKFNNTVNELLAYSESYETIFENNLREKYNIYESVIQKINNTLSVMPPGGAIAGVYAASDKTRGVHKSPANIVLNSVQGLTEDLNIDSLYNLTIDVNEGKYINTIKKFQGKGILVWGARTLAGSHDEWKYISIRRLCSIIEKSVVNSTAWVILEENDSKLWANLRKMIANYLTQKWQQGVLVANKPSEAFFVKTGLGFTMTQQDIQDGRLIMDLGIAITRPAEFIILRFSWKMQEQT